MTRLLPSIFWVLGVQGIGKSESCMDAYFTVEYYAKVWSEVVT
jgi:hypothetical protein